MTFNQTGITNLLSILQSGRQNAQTVTQIETALGNLIFLLAETNT